MKRNDNIYFCIIYLLLINGLRCDKNILNLFSKRGVKIIVVGAGVSGISTAYNLRKSGLNVLLLEARNRPGGRVKTESYSFGYPIDHGAVWVDFTRKGNPFKKYMKIFRTEVVPVNPLNSIGFNRDSIKYPNFQEEIDSTLKGFVDFLDSPRVPNKASASYFIEMYTQIANLKKNKISLLKDYLKLLTYKKYYRREDKKLFKKFILDYVSFAHRKGYYMLPKGYMDFFSNFLKKLRVKYNTNIKSITQRNNLITLRDTKGNNYKADIVVVTVPLGILKKNYIKFRPRLSLEKTRIIQSIPLLKINKVFVEFEEKFWGDQFLIYLQDTEAPVYMGINFHKINNKNMLIFIVNDTVDYNLSSIPLRTVRNYIKRKLSECYPGKNIKITKVVKTSWDRAKFTQGSYTDSSKIEDLSYVKAFRKPEGNIFFAGEHTAIRSASTQGAWLSGEVTAKNILKTLRHK